MNAGSEDLCAARSCPNCGRSCCADGECCYGLGCKRDTLIEHATQSVANVGWDDDPAWKAICECGWETWNNATEADARFAHRMHQSGSSFPSDATRAA